MNGCTMVGLNCNRNIFRNGLPHLYRMLFYYHGQSTKAGTGIQAIYVVSGAFESGKFSSTAFPSAALLSLRLLFFRLLQNARMVWRCV